MLEIVTVCTGNICRSPLAQLLLVTRLSDVDVNVRSAGTRTRAGMKMPAEAVSLALAGGIAPQVIASHRSRLVQADDVRSADLVLAMSRDHRRLVVELVPDRVRNAFTLREIGYLTAELTDSDLRKATPPGEDHSDRARRRFAAMLGAVSARRGRSSAPMAPDDHDVVDPFGRSGAMYQRAADQMAPGLAQVERLIRLACE